jgi:hypothetical protein
MPISAISATIQMFCDRPELSDESVFQELIRAGIPRHYAAQIVEFTPAVFARLMLGPKGVRFSDRFIRQGCSPEERPLTSQPVWAEIYDFAKAHGDSLGRREWIAVAGRSAEFDAVNRLLNDGASLDSIILTPLCLGWPEGGPNQ